MKTAFLSVRGVLLLALMLFMGYSLTIQPAVEAVTNKELQTILRNTSYYGNYGADACQADDSADSSDASLKGNDNIEKGYNYFISKGLTPVQAAAVVGNLQQESSLNPTVIEGGGNTKNPASISTGWGIAQWTPGSKIIGIAKDLKITAPIYKLSTQLDIVYAEMTGTAPTGYQNVLGGLKKTSSLSEAVEFFRANFESGTMGNRQGFAKDILKRYGGNDPNIAVGTGIGADSSNDASNDANTDTTSGDGFGDVSSDCNVGGSAPDDGGTAVAGEGFVGNCLGKGGTASVHCGQCVTYVEWVLTHHADPKKGPYGVLTDQSGRGYHAAYTVTKNLGKKGFAVNKTPAVHAVFTIPSPPLTNGYGHTGIVSKVNTDASGNVKSIIIEESNWVSKEAYGQRTLDAKYIKSHQMSFAHTEEGWHD